MIFWKNLKRLIRFLIFDANMRSPGHVTMLERCGRFWKWFCPGREVEISILKPKSLVFVGVFVIDHPGLSWSLQSRILSLYCADQLQSVEIGSYGKRFKKSRKGIFEDFPRILREFSKRVEKGPQTDKGEFRAVGDLQRDKVKKWSQGYLAYL